MRNTAPANQALGPDLASSADRVQRLTYPGELLADEARTLPGTTSETLLLAFLAELDETILPRQLDLTPDTGNAITLLVAGRRLMSIAKGGDTRPVTQCEPDRTDEVLNLLVAAFQGATKASLTSTRTGRPVAGSGTGIAISALLVSAGTILSPPAKSDPVPALAARLSGRMTAWVNLDSSGNITGQGGDPTPGQRLFTLVQNGLEDVEIQLAHSLHDPGQPGCIVLTSDGPNGLALLYARSRHSGILGLLPACEVQGIQPAWRAFYNGI